MKILEIVDPKTVEYQRAKAELKRLADNDPLNQWTVYLKSRNTSANISPKDEITYDRKRQIYQKTRAIWIKRWRELTSKVDRLKGEVTHNKHKHLPTGMFVTYDTVPGIESPEFIDEIGQLIHHQNEILDDPAAYAIDRFVGHAHGIHSDGVGGWSEHKLEDAFSAQPSPEGITIRQQLEVGIKPILAAIQTRFGDTIYLYRSQRPLDPGSTTRNVLSWTASERFANYHGGDQFTKIVKEIPLSDVVWITDRARQQEFICLNHVGGPNYIGP